MAQAEHEYDLFISYADADRAWVEGYLLDALDQAGVRAHTEETFALGAPRLTEFERAIQHSQRTLLVLSPAYLSDQFGQFTDLLAQTYGLETATWPVIPLLLQPVKLPPRLAMLTALDATDPEEWAQVVERLCAALQHPVPGPAPRPPCPYPGMVSFSESDSDRFYGRDEEVQDLLERLRLHPFVTVIGPSGSGKSSLVYAGLLPALRRSGLFGPGGWVVHSLRPGEAPLSALSAALGGIRSASPQQAVSVLLSAHSDARRLLLIVDQFEETFTLARQGAEAFQRALVRLCQVPDCYVVLTVRADFYADLMASPLWGEIQAHRAEVLPMDEEDLRQAIVRPAEDAGVYVETALVERLVADAAGEPGVLPLVQETLVLLWEQVERRYLPLRAYEALTLHEALVLQEALVLPRRAYGTDIGTAARTGLQVAIARRADAALADLPPTQQAVARRILLRLTQFGEGRADTRRQQRVDQLRAAEDDPALFERTLAHLADHRLLTLGGEEGAEGRVADIAHEALIAGWPTLRGWLDERREAEQTRRRLEDKAEEWTRLGQGSGGLLDEVELLEAERWLSGPDAADLGYDETLPALVAASRATIEEAEREREAAHRRELEQAQTLAQEQQRRAEEQAQAAKKLRRLAVVLAAVFLLAVGVALFAGLMWQRAEKQTKIARARQLAASAELIRASDTGSWNLAGLLAVESLHLDPDTIEARTVIFHLLAHLGRPVSNLQHDEGIVSVVFSPDGRWAATASEDATARVWNAATGEELVRLQHDDRVNSVIFHPDGQRVATASWDGTARVWNAATGEELVRLQHDDRVNSVAYSPDGRWVATASRDRTARVWNVETGEELVHLQHDGQVYSIAFSPDGQQVATTSADTARIWQISTEKEIARLQHAGNARSVVFSPDGQWLATASEDKTARLWNAATGKELFVLRHEAWVQSAVFSPDGRWVATASWDHTARIWDVATGKELARLQHDADVYAVAFSPNGHWVATASLDNTGRIWDVGTWKETARLQHDSFVNAVAFSPDGQWVATASWDNSARIWQVSIERDYTRLQHDDAVQSVVFSPDGQWVATASADSTARVWEVYTGRELARLQHGDVVYSAVFSPDGQRVATASRDTTARVWNVATQEELAQLQHDDEVYSVAFSPDGQWLATASLDKTARIWEISTGKELARLQHDDSVGPAVFSPDGQWVATASRDTTARLWNAATGEALVLLQHDGSVNSVAFSQDGRWVVTASADKTARVWNAATGEELARLQHDNEVSSAVFSPDGQRVATASEDTARIWQISSKKEIARLQHHDRVWSVVFSPDGQWVATASWDHIARIWDVSTEKETAHLQHDDNVWSVVFSPDGRWVATASRDHTAQVRIPQTEEIEKQLCCYLPRNLTRDEWGIYFPEQAYRETCGPCLLEEE